MKNLLVLNGQYYAGENTQNNKLKFSYIRDNGVKIDDAEVLSIIETVISWVKDDGFKLRRIEVLEVREVQDV